MATLAEIRAQYPQYNDMPDAAFLDAMHAKFYADMPRADFNKRLGVPSTPEPSVANAASDVGQQSVLGFNRGMNSILSLPGELIGGAVNMVAPGQGDRFKWDNAVSRAVTRPDIQPQTQAGRYADSVGQAVGSSAIPSAGLAAKALQTQRAATTTLGAAGQQIVNAYRVNPGAAVAADATASVGAGVGQQAAQEGGFGPTGQMVGGLVGAVVPAGVAGAVGGSVRQIQRARANMGEAGAYGKIVDDMPNLGQFADDVAVGGSQHSQAVNRRTMDMLGEEMARANGNVAQAQNATINRMVTELGIAPATAQGQIRRLTSVHENSNLMLGEYPAVARSDAAQRNRQPGNVNLDELGRVENSTTQAKLDYLANNGNAQSAQDVRNAIGRRQEDLSPALGNNLTASGPQLYVGNRATGPASIADVEAMIAQSDNLASQEYRAAYQGPINNQMMMNVLPRLLAWNERRAAGRAGDIEGAITRAVGQFYTNTPNGRMAMMSLQQLQDARGVVRGQMREYRNQGRDDLQRAVQPIYSQITRLMEQMSPTWATANRRWADGRLDEVATELGDAFAKNAGPRFREQMREFNQMAPQAQDVVRVHWVQQQLDKLQNAPDSASVSKYFANDHMRSMVRDLLGGEAAVSFARALRDQKVAESSQRMMANSATHRRGQTQKQMDSDTGLDTATQLASPGGIRSWLIEKAHQLALEHRNRPMADILTTPMSDTARVAMHLHRMREQQNRLSQFAQPRLAPPAMVGRIAPAINPLMEGTNNGR